jgi:hypothetical protein
VPNLVGDRAEGGARQWGGCRALTGGEGGMVFYELGRRRAVKEGRDHFKEMMWCCWCSWLGLRSSVEVGRRRGRTGGGTGARRRRGPAIPVEELEIGLLGELRWIVGMLFVLRIGDGE